MRNAFIIACCLGCQGPTVSADPVALTCADRNETLDIQFDVASSRLKPKSRHILQEFADQFRGDDLKVSVTVSSTEDEKSDNFQRNLGNDRAAAVAQELGEKMDREIPFEKIIDDKKPDLPLYWVRLSFKDCS